MKSSRKYGILAALLLVPALAWAQAPATPAKPAPNAITHPAQKKIGTPSARQYSSALIVINSRGAKLDGQKLVLDGVLPTATLFTSRPVRSVGHMVTPDMADIWRTGSFAKDPPNATVSVFSKDGSTVSDLVVTLNTAKLDGDKLTFDVQVLEGSLGNADGPASVFIDTIWFGIGSHGAQYYGQTLESIAKHFKQKMTTPWRELPAKVRFVLRGLARSPVQVKRSRCMNASSVLE